MRAGRVRPRACGARLAGRPPALAFLDTAVVYPARGVDSKPVEADRLFGLTDDGRHLAVADRLASGVNDDPAGRMTDDRRLHRERVLEAPDHPAVEIVHDHVGAGLDLGEDSQRRIDVVERSKDCASRVVRPVRRPQPLHPAALLVDQDGCVGDPHEAPQFGNQPSDLPGVVDIAPE